MKIKKAIVATLFALLPIGAYATDYTKSDSIKVESLLKEAQSMRLKNQQERVMYFMRKFYGIPYVAGTLDKNKNEQLVVNLRQLDCTTYVENVVALSLCLKDKQYKFADFCRKLSFIRYRKGEGIKYASRLHYFTDWINDNTKAGFCSIPQTTNPPFSAVQNVSVNFMSTHSDKYPMLSGNRSTLAAIRKMEKKLSGMSCRYIPKSRIDNSALLRRTIHNGDIIVILTDMKGLDTRHLGFALWKSDGLHLVNASLLHKKVVEEPMLLRTYLSKHKTMTGIRILRLND